MTVLPMPAPWRMFLQNFRQFESGSDLYTKLTQSFLGRKSRELPSAAIQNWNADQVSGRLEIHCDDDSIVHAGMEILGTHDGTDFLWADANENVRHASAASGLRAHIASFAPEFAGQDRLHLSSHDMQALLALAGDLNDADNTFVAQSNRSTILMILKEVTLTTPKHVEPERGSLLGRLFRRGQSPASQRTFSSPLELMNAMLATQLAEHAVDPEKLLTLENKIADIHAAYLAGEFGDAISAITQVKGEIGDYFLDQEPAGWLLYCEGACLLAEGDLNSSHLAFNEAMRAISVPCRDSIRLGLARSSPTSDLQVSYLVAIYIASPDWFMANVEPAEVELVKVALRRAEESRDPAVDQPLDVLKAAIAERYEQELRAHELSSEAAKFREQDHILCDADAEARLRINAMYRELSLKWFTTGRVPDMPSYSSHPNENPSTLKSMQIVEESEDVLVATTTHENEHGLELNFRYKVINSQASLSDKSLWRIEEVWSVWDDEEIKIH